MYKIKNRLYNRILVALLCLSASVSVSTAILPFHIDALFVFGASPIDATEDAIKESSDLVAASDLSLAKAATAITKLNVVRTELEKAKDVKKADKKSIEALETLKSFLEKNADNALTPFNEAGDELSKQDAKYAPLIAKLKALTPTSAAIDAASKKLEDQKKKADTKRTELTTAKDSLKDSVTNVVRSEDALIADVKTPLDAIDKVVAGESVDNLLKSLPQDLPTLTSANETIKSLENTLPALQIQINKFVTSSVAPAGSLKTVRDLFTSIVTQKVDGWINTVTADLRQFNKELIDLRLNLDKDLPKHSMGAIKILDDSEDKKDVLKSVFNAATDVGIKTETGAIKTAAGELDEQLKDLDTRLNYVREGLSGQYVDFVNDFVSLYYFTDVQNLMMVLNPRTTVLRDVGELKIAAANARKAVVQATTEVNTAQGAVSSLQVTKRNLVNELTDVQNAVDVSSRSLADANRRLIHLGTDDPKRRAAQEKVDDLSAKNKEDKDRLAELNTQENNFPEQIKSADGTLRDAQKLLIDAKNRLVLNIDADSEAFAQARDNEPVFVAPIDGTSKDPLKQIAIYAFGNRKILYLRGSKAKVTKAKNIISFFDRPAPQARLALWTLELSGQTSARKNLNEFNESLRMVDYRLSNTRSQIAATLAFLRKCINEKVNEVATQRLSGLKQTSGLNSEYVDQHRWARSFFYEKEVLKRLGFDETPPVSRNDQGRLVALNTLPDPISAGTLGEALVILSLAKSDYRRDIINRFTHDIEKEIAEVTNNDRISTDTVKIDSNSFNLTKKALDADNPQSSFTPIQNEIVNSIILASVPKLFRRLDQLNLGQVPVLESTELKSPEIAEKNMKKEVASVIDFIWYAYGLSPADLFGVDISPDEAADKLVKDMNEKTLKIAGAKTVDERNLVGKSKITLVAKKLSCINNEKNIFRLANAQIAKADNLIKQLIDAFDEDINRAIVQPAVYGLRKNITDGKQISVGVINRTSMLATNRLPARVDARGSAQLTVGEETDILGEAQMLAQIIMSSKTGNILGAFNSLQSTKKERDTSEIYGINSGDIFKVTPVFDPAGQSLRFQFDHTHGNFVTDPDGTVQPALPRIERHTVNTEVQLANLELREISRFESNGKMGIPTTYKGGVPIFKDIPYVNKVPLLGWFVKRSGKAATVQESLILGQTTMYPTIADIFDLLSGDDYNYISRDKCSE